jgi:plasmid stabilization system protein ParE
MRLIYHPEAERELVEATLFYEGKAPGLGDRFLREFEAAIAAILDAPDRWRVIEGEVRRHLMRRFPYGVYYRTEGDEVRILILKHHSRHPDSWKDRLGDPD